MSVLNSKDIEYMSYTLSDVGVIELLIAYRYKYDDYLYLAEGDVSGATGAVRLNEEIIVTYLDLDVYIEACGFSEQQLHMIKMLGEGYSHVEIAESLGIRLSTVSGRLKTIYKKIAEEGKRRWRKCIYINKLGLKTKRCSKCKEELPATPEFYRDDSRNKEGLQSRCRKCES